MAGEKARAKMSDKKYLKTVDGIDIHVTTGGKFEAEIDFTAVTRVKLGDLERLVRQRRKALKVFYPSDYSLPLPRLVVTEITNFEKSGKARKADRGLIDSYRHLFVYDEGLMSELEVLADEFIELRVRWADVLSRATGVNDNNIEELQNARLSDEEEE